MPLKIFEKVSPFLKFRVTVIGSLGQAMAAVVDADEVLVRLLGRPTGTEWTGTSRTGLRFHQR